MITLICTSCQETLEMDDAFAGGVCRCQHCGTIQTVPSRTRRSASPEFGAGAGASVGAGEPLYRHGEADGGAEQMTSSGLRRSAMTAPPVATAHSAPAPGFGAWMASHKQLVAIIGGAVVALALAIALLVLTRSHSKSGATAPPDEDTQEYSGPSFVGVNLTDPSVVYILDRGNATQNFFDPLKAACWRSLELIGPDKKFAVIMTDNGEPPFMFPKEGLASATPEQLDELRTQSADIGATGNSHLRSALEAAIARKPSTIVVATGKWSLDPDDAAALRDAAGKGIKIDTFAIGQTPGSPAMEEAAAASGGTFKQISEPNLRNFSNAK